MSREAVRSMKRAIADASQAGNDEGRPIARAAAVSLLERSISFGHGRLAVIRLGIAAEVGAEIPPSCWAYCEAVANGSGDFRLRALFERAQHGRARALQLEKCE